MAPKPKKKSLKKTGALLTAVSTPVASEFEPKPSDRSSVRSEKEFIDRAGALHHTMKQLITTLKKADSRIDILYEAQALTAEYEQAFPTGLRSFYCVLHEIFYADLEQRVSKNERIPLDLLTHIFDRFDSAMLEELAPFTYNNLIIFLSIYLSQFEKQIRLLDVDTAKTMILSGISYEKIAQFLTYGIEYCMNDHKRSKAEIQIKSGIYAAIFKITLNASFMKIAANSLRTKLDKGTVLQQWTTAKIYDVAIQMMNKALSTNTPLTLDSYSNFISSTIMTNSLYVPMFIQCFDVLKRSHSLLAQDKLSQEKIVQIFAVGFDYIAEHVIREYVMKNLPIDNSLITCCIDAIDFLKKNNLRHDKAVKSFYKIVQFAQFTIKLYEKVTEYYNYDDAKNDPDRLRSILSLLAKSTSVSKKDLRFFAFTIKQIQHLLSPELIKINMLSIYAALNMRSDLTYDDLSFFYKLADELKQRSPEVFEIIFRSLGKMPQIAAKELAFYLDKAASHTRLNQTMVESILHTIPCMTDFDLEFVLSIMNMAHKNGVSTSDTTYYHITRRIMEADRIRTWSARGDIPDRLRQELIALETIQERTNAWSMIPTTDPLSALKMACAKAFVMPEEQDNIALATHQLVFLKRIEQVLFRLEALAARADSQNVSSDVCYLQLVKNLEDVFSNMDRIERRVDTYQTKIKQAEDRAIELAKKPLPTLQKIWHLINTGDINAIDEANGFLDVYIQQNLQQDNYYLYLAKTRCLVKLGFYDAAMTWIYKTTTQFPDKNKRPILLLWGCCCKFLGQYTTAIQVYHQIINDFPQQDGLQNITLLSQLAHCYVLSARPDDYDNALMTYEKLRHLLTEEMSTSVREAQKYAEQAIRIEGYIAACYRKQNRLQEAEQVLMKIKHHPEGALQLGSLYLSQDRHAEAIALYEPMLEKSGFALRMYKELLLTSLNLKWKKEKEPQLLIDMQQRLKAYVLTHANNSDQHVLKDHAMLMIRECQFEDALNHLNRIEERWGKDEYIYRKIALCQRKLGHVIEAIERLTSFPQYRENRNILLQLAECYTTANNDQQASATFELLLEQFPSFNAGYLKAMIYYIAKDDAANAQACLDGGLKNCHENIPFMSDLAQKAKRYFDRRSRGLLNLAEELPITNESTTDDECDDITEECRKDFNCLLESTGRRFIYFPTEPGVKNRFFRLHPRYKVDDEPVNSRLIEALDLAKHVPR